MKKIYLLSTFVFLLSCLLAICPMPAQTLRGNTWAEVQRNQGGTIILTYIHTPGLAYKNGYGNLDGVCFDIIKQFIEYMQRSRGVNIKAQVMPETKNFNQFMATIQQANGGVFGLGNITITAQRELQYDFSPPFVKNLSFLLTHERIPTLSALSGISRQFQNLKAYTVKGSTNEQFILSLKRQYFPALKIDYVANSGEALSKIVQDPYSFTCLDFNYYAKALRSGQPIKRHPVGDNSTERFGIIMPNNSDWQPLWREFFQTYGFTRSPVYRNILIEHLGLSAVRALERYRD